MLNKCCHIHWLAWNIKQLTRRIEKINYSEETSNRIVHVACHENQTEYETFPVENFTIFQQQKPDKSEKFQSQFDRHSKRCLVSTSQKEPSEVYEFVFNSEEKFLAMLPWMIWLKALKTTPFLSLRTKATLSKCRMDSSWKFLFLDEKNL